MLPLRLYRYILEKFVSSFVAALAVFTALFLMDQASRQVEQFAPRAGNVNDFILSLVLLVTPLLTYTIPLAFLLAMIWTLEQMKQDRELTAIMASGVDPVTLMAPFLAVSVITMVAAYIVTAHLGPMSLRRYNGQLNSMAQRSFTSDLKAGTFFSGVPDTLILVGDFDRDSGKIDGFVMVRSDLPERKSGEMILAASGTIMSPAETGDDIIMTLENGTIHPVTSTGENYSSASFRQLVSRVKGPGTGAAVRAKQMLMAASNKEIRDLIATPDPAETDWRRSQYVMELHRRTSLPLTVLLYPFIVFPAAVSTGRHGKATAFTSTLLIFLLSSFLYTLGTSLVRQGLLQPGLGVWLADIVLLALGLAVFVPYSARHSALRAANRRVGK